jgi:predicted nuclease of restriction endonuclease-like (RecB) superfamily
MENKRIVKQTVSQLELPPDYSKFLENLKTRIKKARLKAALSANAEVITLYWEIGRNILSRQEAEGWGTKVIDRLAIDLSKAFPDMRGFSPRNLKFMRAFAEAYPEKEIVKQIVSQIPWGHNIRILQKVKKTEERLWYARQATEKGWSRNILIHQIESNAFSREGQAVTNFRKTLPNPQSDLARQALKDPYVFDFLAMDSDFREREFEKALIDHLKEFLIELGVGFAYVGSQYHMEIGDQDFYLDLLFYHLRLRCYIVIELKTGDFKPEYAGKINFYLSAVDDTLNTDQDNPSIGIILCKTRNRVIAEYALRDMNKPIGISRYTFAENLPEEFKTSLPTVEELEEEMMNNNNNI